MGNEMTYTLGVDLGTTYTAAAVWRSEVVEMVPLGTHSNVIPSVVHLRDDGTLLTGEAAVRRSLSVPGRTAHEFKRRLGDPAPLLLGGTPIAAVDLMAALLRDVLAHVTERQGGPPDTVALTHPANWGQFKLDLLRHAADSCGLSEVRLVSEPVAAAVDYAAGSGVAPGDIVAVYDLGGGTFDAAVLRRTATGFETLGEPVGLERLGGIDFDHAVVAHVERTMADTFAALDPSDSDAAAALVRLRQACVAAKEGLSEDSDVVIPVALPGAFADVRLTRPEFEAMIAPALTEPLRAFRRGLAGAGVNGADLHTVLLVGGSSRVPLVAETVAGELGRPVAIDTHPKHAVALGAARIAATPSTSTASSTFATSTSAAASTPTVTPAAPSAPAAPADAEPTVVADTGDAPRPRRRRARYAGAAAFAALLAGGGAFLAFGGGAGAGPSSTATTVADRPAPTASATGPSTTAAAPFPSAPLCESASGMCALITGIRLDADRYVVDYATVGFDPLVAGEDAGATDRDHHVHFFFDSTAPGNAGTNGRPPGSWELWGLQRGRGDLVFDEFTTEDAGDADQLCVAVATSGHEMLEDADRTGNCVDLPA